MGTMIRWLRDLRDGDLGLAGGKGVNLGRLVQLKLPVPPGFVISVEAYRAFLSANHLAGFDPDTLHAPILSAPIPSEVSTPILDAYRELGAPTVAVRSSGTAEDLATASFAGQHDTVLNVSGPEALLDAVRACWASLWSPRAIAYRRQVGWNDQDVALAIVVQTMVPAEWAGVLFTADPVTGRRDRMIVEAVAGLGEALVSGQVTGKRVVVEKSDLRLVNGDNVLPQGALEELAQLAIRIERAFGRPQDIEWAYAGGRCYLLQSRPLTALRENRRPVVARKPRRFSRMQRESVSNMIDHYPFPSYPFDSSLYFRPMIERLGGSVNAALGFAPIAVDDIMIEMADGVYQMLPPDLRPTIGVLKLPVKLLAALRVDQDVWLVECRATLVVLAQQIDAEELSPFSDQELLLRMEMLQSLLLDLFFPRFRAFPRGMLSRWGLGLLVRLAAGERAGRLEGELLAEIPCTTIAINQGLTRLADQIRSSAKLRQVFRDEHPDRLPARLSESSAGRSLLADVEYFLRRYGYRESAMLGSAFPGWRDDPAIVYGLLKGMAAGNPANGAREPGEGDPVDRASREVVVGFKRRFGPGERLLKPLFFKLRDVTRSFVAYREDSHYYLFMPFPVVRRLALELGRRLAGRGVLEAAEDIFFLEIGEIKQLGPASVVRESVRKRKAARKSVEGRFTTVPAELLEQGSSGSTVRGVPVSPGRAAGPVRLILSEQDFWKLQPGEVLVAHYTNPTWTPLFAVASAVVVDAGGTTSHAAIVAREYGIPAVMGTRNATKVLRDGQRVLVDGGKGSVVPVGERVNRAGDAGVLPGRVV